jgi:hypothetical protein
VKRDAVKPAGPITGPRRRSRVYRAPTIDRVTALAEVLLLAAGIAGCAQSGGVPGTPTLSKPWMLGIERMRGDPELELPFTNRFMADLSAMPNVQVVLLGNDRNGFLFNGWSGGKVLVSPWLHREGTCMNVTYTIFRSGQQQAVFGLVIAPVPAGVEPDSACVDRAAAQFYQALVVQGL